jgi:hypothetical protein
LDGSQGLQADRPSALFAGPRYGGFFLFLTIKRQLAGKALTQETFKAMWEGATRTIAEEDNAAAFRH